MLHVHKCSSTTCCRLSSPSFRFLLPLMLHELESLLLSPPILSPALLRPQLHNTDPICIFFYFLQYRQDYLAPFFPLKKSQTISTTTFVLHIPMCQNTAAAIEFRQTSSLTRSRVLAQLLGCPSCRTLLQGSHPHFPDLHVANIHRCSYQATQHHCASGRATHPLPPH